MKYCQCLHVPYSTVLSLFIVSKSKINSDFNAGAQEFVCLGTKLINLFSVDHVSICFLFMFARMEGKYACENPKG